MLLGSGPWKHLVKSSTLAFCYGLYLVHPMLFRLYAQVTDKFRPSLQPSVGHFDLIVLRFAVVSAAAIGVSYLSRKYYEEWFLQMKDRVVPQSTETTVAPPVKALVTVSSPSAAISAATSSAEPSESF